jgi:uncharacterized protein
MSNNLVVYHSGCMDGMCAAWVAQKNLEVSVLEGGVYGKKLENDPTGKNIYIVDFSYPEQELEDIIRVCNKLVILDHHKTAMEGLEKFRRKYEDDPRVDIRFDLSKSGANLAWEYFNHTEAYCWLVRYIEDRDLWKWEWPHSREINTALGSYPLSKEEGGIDFQAWEELYKKGVFQGLDFLVQEGIAINRYKDNLLDRMMGHKQIMDIGGHSVWGVNSCVMQSELGERLCNQDLEKSFAAVWYKDRDGIVRFSLRSREGGADVAAIAKTYGGGGHPRAAGFELGNSAHA